jgi:hypothetical protein
MYSKLGNKNILVALAVFIVSILIWGLLVMWIWNEILVPKIKGWQLEKINVGDALLLGVFGGLMSSGNTCYNMCNGK